MRALKLLCREPSSEDRVLAHISEEETKVQGSSCGARLPDPGCSCFLLFPLRAAAGAPAGCGGHCGPVGGVARSGGAAAAQNELPVHLGKLLKNDVTQAQRAVSKGLCLDRALRERLDEAEK